jgi:hypothetical protein
MRLSPDVSDLPGGTIVRMECRCGETLSTTSVPNDIELTVYTDREWDQIINAETIDPVSIPHPEYNVWKCPKCERIYFFNWDEGSPVKVYKLEE